MNNRLSKSGIHMSLSFFLFRHWLPFCMLLKINLFVSIFTETWIYWNIFFFRLICISIGHVECKTLSYIFWSYFVIFWSFNFTPLILSSQTFAERWCSNQNGPHHRLTRIVSLKHMTSVLCHSVTPFGDLTLQDICYSYHHIFSPYILTNTLSILENYVTFYAFWWEYVLGYFQPYLFFRGM